MPGVIEWAVFGAVAGVAMTATSFVMSVAVQSVQVWYYRRSVGAMQREFPAMNEMDGVNDSAFEARPCPDCDGTINPLFGFCPACGYGADAEDD